MKKIVNIEEVKKTVKSKPKKDALDKVMPAKKMGRPAEASETTEMLSGMIDKFCCDNFQEAVDCWQMITNPKDKLMLYLKMMEYSVPKKQSIEHKNADEKPDYIVKLDELAKLSS